jgi:uncharacterized membrane protein YccC
LLAASRSRAALRVALSSYVTNGASAALGLALIAALIHLMLGPFAAAAATVGVIVVVPPDQPAPRRGKFWQLLPAAVIGPPLFFAIQELHRNPFQLAGLLVTATFIAFLGAAWGKRGLPISISVMFAMIFSMAMPPRGGHEAALMATLYFAIGGAAYLVYATAANAVLNARYRVLTLVDALFAVTRLMRTQARHFAPEAGSTGEEQSALLGRLLAQQAALTDQLQTVRNILLESPRTPRRQQLAGMLMQLLELRDHLVACELDLETVKGDGGHSPVLHALRDELERLAAQVDDMADALLLNRLPPPYPGARALPPALNARESEPDASAGAPSPQLLARALVSRIGHIHDEVQRLVELARGDVQPDLAVVRTMWQMFVSPTSWSWRPFLRMWRWDAPPLRHAIRAALAIATGQAISMSLPWGTHDYWILLTIIVVLRGSLAQTLERRNSRIAGTFMGCVLAGAILMLHPPTLLLVLLVTIAQGIAHAFAIKRYVVTAVAATVLALLQAHQLNAALSPAFEVLERIADTLIGVGIAWAFSYVLPSWERTQIPALVARALAAQARHAQQALALGQLRAVDNDAELGWRLARREAYDSLSALVQATQRSLSEPRAVRPPLDHLERLLALSYELLAQLTAVKTMLLQRRGRLDPEQIQRPLQEAARAIDATLAGTDGGAPARVDEAAPAARGPVPLADPFEDLSPWLLRRLQLASGIAREVRGEATQVLEATRA